MELDAENLKRIDPLSLTNMITTTALVSVLVRKGLLTEAELTEEVRRLRARVEGLTRQEPGKP